MSISTRLTAEKRFIATQKKTRMALTETQEAQLERAERTAGLRKLRLAKEASDKNAAATQAAAKAKRR